MRLIHFIILLIVIIGTIVLCVQNSESTTIKFAGGSVNLPLPVLVLIVYLLGMLSGWSVLSVLRRSLRSLTEKDS